MIQIYEPLDKPRGSLMGVQMDFNKKRVLLWWAFLPDGLISALGERGYEVTAIIQSPSEETVSYSLSDVWAPSATLGPAATKESLALYSGLFETYSKNISRVRISHSRARPNRPNANLSEPNSLSHDEVSNLFFIQYAGLCRLIENHRPSAIWFSRPPHLGMDNLLYHLARERGIQTLVFQQSLFPERFFFGRSIDELFTLAADMQIFENASTLKSLDDLNLFYMRPKSNERPLNSALLRQRMAEGDLTNAILRRLRRRLIKLGMHRAAAIAHLGVHQSSREMLIDLLNNYKRNSRSGIMRTAVPTPAPENFVYFPLHLEPEATTSEFGGAFKEQINAVEALEQILPDGWVVLIKENPKQTYFYRSELFYLRIQQCERVRWADSTESSRELIERSQIVSTITGTAGYEALSLGKPVVYFGNAWFQRLNGCVKFDWSLDLAHLSSTEVDVTKLNAQVQELQAHCGDGLIYSSYSRISDKPLDQLALNAADSIRRVDDALYGLNSTEVSPLPVSETGNGSDSCKLPRTLGSASPRLGDDHRSDAQSRANGAPNGF